MLGERARAFAEAAGELDLALAGRLVRRVIAMERGSGWDAAFRTVNIGGNGKACGVGTA